MAIQVVPQIWSQYTLEALNYTNDMISMGVVRTGNLTQNGDQLLRIPRLKPLSVIGDAVKIASGTTITPVDLQSYTENGVVVRRGNAIQGETLNEIMTGTNDVQFISSQIAPYFSEAIKKSFKSVLTGIFTPSTGVLSSTHQLNITGETTSTLNASAIIDAKAKLGEFANAFTTIIVHSKQFADMLKAGVVTYVSAATYGQQVLVSGEIPTFLGMRVIVSDVLGAHADVSSATAYAAYLCGGQPFYLDFQRQLSFETDRNILSGDGVDILKFSGHYVPHVFGVSYTGNTMNPTEAQLATAANWTKVAANNTAIPLVEIITR